MCRKLMTVQVYLRRSSGNKPVSLAFLRLAQVAVALLTRPPPPVLLYAACGIARLCVSSLISLWWCLVWAHAERNAGERGGHAQERTGRGAGEQEA